MNRMYTIPLECTELLNGVNLDSIDMTMQGFIRYASEQSRKPVGFFGNHLKQPEKQNIIQCAIYSNILYREFQRNQSYFQRNQSYKTPNLNNGSPTSPLLKAHGRGRDR